MTHFWVVTNWSRNGPKMSFLTFLGTVFWPFFGQKMSQKMFKKWVKNGVKKGVKN